MPTDRVRCVPHRGVELIEIDFSGLTRAAEFVPVIEAAQAVVTSRPPGSARTLTIARGVRLDRTILDQLQAMMRANKPHVKASAVVGVDGFLSVVLRTLLAMTGREMRLCDEEGAAREYLAGQG